MKPDSAIIIAGDFNHCRLNKVLQRYKQFANCATRSANILNLVYCDKNNAFKCPQLPPLGASDHLAILCLPTYRQKLKRLKPTVVQTKLWDEESTASLQGCFACANWDVFKEEDQSLCALIDVVSSYITLCEDMCIPTKQIKIYPNQKPWLTPELRQMLKEKHEALKSNDPVQLKEKQKQVNHLVIKCKEQINKIEKDSETNSTRNARKGLQTITGRPKKKISLSQPGECTRPIQQAEHQQLRGQHEHDYSHQDHKAWRKWCDIRLRDRCQQFIEAPEY